MIIIPTQVFSNAARASYHKQHKRHDDALIQALLECCDGKMRKTTLVARHGMLEFHLRFDAEQGAYHLSIPCRLAGRFTIKRKHALARRLASFIPAWSIRSHDPRFDETYSIHTRDLRITEDIICQRRVRDAVNKLMGRQASGIHLDGDRVRLTGTRKSLGTQIDADGVLAIVEELAVVAAAVTHWASTHERRPAPKRDNAVVTVSVVIGVLGVCGFVVMILAIGNYPLVTAWPFVPAALGASFAALLLVIVPVTLGLSHRTSPYALIFGFAMLSLLVVTLFVSSTMLLGNGLFDGGARTVGVEPICCKRWKQSKDDKKKNKAKYYAGIRAERKASGVAWFRVYKTTYDTIEEERDGLMVTTAPGALGFPWVEKYKVVDDWQRHP
jgi:hypothetical protein